MELEMFELAKAARKYRYISIDTEFPGFLRSTSRDASLAERYEDIKFNVHNLKMIQLGITFSDVDSSITLLRTNGIDLEINILKGVSSERFAKKFWEIMKENRYDRVIGEGRLVCKIWRINSKVERIGASHQAGSDSLLTSAVFWELKKCSTKCLNEQNRDSMRVHDTFTAVFKVWKDIATILPVRDAVVNIFGQFMDIRLGNSDNQLIQYWFCEYCGVGHPSQGKGRYHIDHCTIETITWDPWLESEVSEIEDVLTAKLLSRKRMPLQVPNGNCEYYLGDRCWRQLEGEARIPLDPPLNILPHISPAALHEMRQAGFLDCEQFVVGEERETYALYWAEQISEVGHMLTDSQRMGNIDMFGPTALRAGITPVVVASASVHSASQDFSLPGEAEGPDPG
ncbi:hypothetical protein GIB67_000627 [Kingdonia uniflora]|uniref:poly(A)-specific ribonuclease n=1 Tax=Kingdonia uniflora TaxID=39325 RepID=A0A7J7ND87_9MAGN|nr:hypothetical protein GIB67_000627 [Kingdonia uniflora]